MSAAHSATIDLFEFARCGLTAEGELALARTVRLDLASRDGVLRWNAVGRVSRQNKLFFDLGIEGVVAVTCQRCLEPVKLKVSLNRHFVVAKTDKEADAVPLDDDEIEVVVGSETFSFDELVEDEVILSLPVVPTHQVCQHASQKNLNHDLDAKPKLSDELDGVGAGNRTGTGKISPFAVLAKLKK